MTITKKIILLCLTLALGTLLTLISSVHFEQEDITTSTAIASLPPVEVEKEVEGEQAASFYKQLSGELQEGDTLGQALKRHDISSTVRRQILSNLSKCLDFRQLRPQDKYRIFIDEQGDLVRCEYEADPLTLFSVTRDKESFIAEQNAVTLDVKVAQAEGVVSSSLYAAFAKQNLQAKLIYAFADIFSSRIDFNTELKKGDRFKLIYEKYFKDGNFVGFGNILYASFTQQDGMSHEGYYYHSNKTAAAHFDANGQELGTSFIKSPVPMGRVTSKFSWNRKHPILGVVRPHLGVDLAAPVGTPIMAAADGKVVFVGRKGGFGRQIILSHASGYRTHYGHLSRYRKGLKKGNRVKQKEIIGYVGSSGLSTGPHLDYRLENAGQFLNPFSQKFKPKSVLAGDQLAGFRQQISTLSRFINSSTKNEILSVRQLTVQPEEKITIL